MAKNLVIVESPTKVKSISKYLGKDYIVTSSKGHIRDLSTKGKFGLGVDIENHFKPDYKTIKGKKPIIDELKKEAKKVDMVYLATDPDREGEAIAWHIYDILGLNDANYNRVLFPEITKKGVLNGIKNALKIDRNLVNSQETRRILDRIIGFRLSKLVQSKTDGKSAGRVQSVALKLIVDRERAIKAFVKEEYWNIIAKFDSFNAELTSYKNEDIKIKNEEEADQILSSLHNDFKVQSVIKKEKNKSSKPVYETSTLQQDASNKLNLSAKRTMSIAQKLYEGIDLDNETVGLITYMRTDSVRISDEFVNETKNYIINKYGKEYAGNVKTAKKKDNVQDGHEGIRPTSIERTPEKVKPYLKDDEFKLYRMIYYRALSSLMHDAKVEGTTILLNNNDYIFKATGQVIVFDGYLKAYKDYEDTKDEKLPLLNNNDLLSAEEIKKEQHFTEPPARYTEARLIKEMKELGIGRPSTYATIVDNIKNRGYVTTDKKKFIPTEIGFEVTDKLQQYFSHIINVEYTANMENELDEVALGKEVWYEILEKFYNEFEPAVEEALEKLPKKEVKETGEDCPLCNHPLVIRNGKYGEFIACSNFPKCKYIKSEKKEESIIIKFPNCDEGQIVEKHSKRGKLFYGCNNYPKCKTAYWDKPTGEKCPECEGMLTLKNDKIKCSNCDYTK